MAQDTPIIKKLKYPLSDADYKARVKFTVLFEESTSAGATEIAEIDNKNAIKQLQAERKRLLEIDGKTSSADLHKAQQLRDEITELQNEVGQFKGGDKNSQVASTKRELGTSVAMYLPMGLSFRDNVTYENFDLGAVGAMVEGGMGIASSMAKGIGSFVSGITGSASGDMAKLAGVQLASKFGTFSDEVGGALKLQGGVTVNPNTRTLFKQANIRDFSFAFKMIAKSKEEAREIEEIIKFFRTELYPDDITIDTGGGSSISVGYVFPNKFLLEFAYDGRQIPGLAKIKPCYLRDVSTTFNASQMGFHQDGSFMEVDMTLSFQEEKALVRKDVAKGGY